MGQGKLIADGKEISHRTQVAPSVGAAICNLRCAVQRCAAADDYGANRLSRVNPSRQVHGGSRIEIKGSPRKSKSYLVQKTRRKNVGLTEADYLFTQGNICQGKGIAGRRMSLAIVGGIDGCQRIVVRKYLVESRGSKIFANCLQRVGEGLRYSAWRSGGSQ